MKRLIEIILLFIATIICFNLALYAYSELHKELHKQMDKEDDHIETQNKKTKNKENKK